MKTSDGVMVAKSKSASRPRPSGAGTLYLVHVLTHSTRAQLDNLLAEFGLSSFQYTILNVIQRHEGLSSARLSRRFHVTPQAMGELILLLEKKGLVGRTEDPGNRKVLHLELTAAGLDVVSRADLVVRDFEHKVFAGRTPAELEAFRDIVSETLASLRDRG